MTSRALKLFLMTGVVMLFMAGCVTQPIYTVDNAMIVSSTDKNLKLEDIKKAIIKAGSMRGWVIKEVEPGHLVGTLFARKHMAKVNINYDNKSYSITYADSENLNYDGDMIHGSYNKWVKNLQRDIEVQLNILTL